MAFRCGKSVCENAEYACPSTHSSCFFCKCPNCVGGQIDNCWFRDETGKMFEVEE
jgi:hypothetical protein